MMQLEWIDLHSHLLPGLDDGARDMDESLAMARQYAASGFSTVVATPHWIRGTRWMPSNQQVVERVAQLQETLETEGIPLRILPGMEVALELPLTNALASLSRRQPLGGSAFVLLELPIANLSLHLEDLLHCIDEGSRIIFAHPERCRVVQDNPDFIRFFVGKGALVQVNLESFTGGYGAVSQQTAELLLQGGCVHCIASDSHGINRRTPPTREGLDQLAATIGQEAVQQGLTENPSRILSGQPAPPIISMTGLQSATSIVDRGRSGRAGRMMDRLLGRRRH